MNVGGLSSMPSSECIRLMTSCAWIPDLVRQSPSAMLSRFKGCRRVVHVAPVLARPRASQQHQAHITKATRGGSFLRPKGSQRHHQSQSSGLRWRGGPARSGPHKTPHNRLARWARMYPAFRRALTAKTPFRKMLGFIGSAKRLRPCSGRRRFGSRSQHTTADVLSCLLSLCRQRQ